jgi:predicted DNA-binding ribbon-helix-helix protein
MVSLWPILHRKKSKAAMLLQKKSVSLSGHRTSVALEPEFWAVLERESERDGMSLSAYVGRIDGVRGERPLASALRLRALAANQS